MYSVIEYNVFRVPGHAPFRWICFFGSALLALRCYWHRPQFIMRKELQVTESSRKQSAEAKDRDELPQLPDIGIHEALVQFPRSITRSSTSQSVGGTWCLPYSSKRHALAAVTIVTPNSHGKGCAITSSPIAFNHDSRNNSQALFLVTAPRSSNYTSSLPSYNVWEYDHPGKCRGYLNGQDVGLCRQADPI